MTIKVTYQNGVFRPLDPLEVADLRPGQPGEVHVAARAASGSEPEGHRYGTTAESLAELFARIDALPREPGEPSGPMSAEDEWLYGDYLYRKKMGRDADGEPEVVS